jgi:hypothetical protein
MTGWPDKMSFYLSLIVGHQKRGVYKNWSLIKVPNQRSGSIGIIFQHLKILNFHSEFVDKSPDADHLPKGSSSSSHGSVQGSVAKTPYSYGQLFTLTDGTKVGKIREGYQCDENLFSSKIGIFVQSSFCHCLYLSLKNSEKVITLKEAIYQKAGIAISRQRLVYGGKILHNEDPLVFLWDFK